MRPVPVVYNLFNFEYTFHHYDLDEESIDEMRNPNFNWRSMYSGAMEEIEWFDPWCRIVRYIRWKQEIEARKFAGRTRPVVYEAAQAA